MTKTKQYVSFVQEYESVYNESMWYLNTVGHVSEYDANRLNDIVKGAKKSLNASEYDDFLTFTIDLNDW